MYSEVGGDEKYKNKLNINKSYHGDQYHNSSLGPPLPSSSSKIERKLKL